MICKIGDNIISSLGFTTEENFTNVKNGKTGIAHYNTQFELPEPFMASLIDRNLLEEQFLQIKQTTMEYTLLEAASILSIAEALKTTAIDPSDARVLFVLSTTKGNIHLLDEKESKKWEAERIHLWRSAQLISQYFDNQNFPLVVSNACISGAAALIAAKREIESGRYDYAVVVGVDMLSKFIISGFQSFKALSETFCKPFDKHRTGLNLGEAAATIILARKEEPDLISGDIILREGAIRNDSNHISAPSRTGEGSFLALRKIIKNNLLDEIAFVNAHGTATPYNDEMEAIALVRAGLDSVPINSLKGYFGHTLGAAGVLESIISMRALDEKMVLKTAGFEQIEAFTINNKLITLPICNENITTDKKQFIKMMSGFGGVNAALLFEKLN